MSRSFWRISTLLLDLFLLPGPTAAAIGGHAVAAGCQLTARCDVRVMATGQARLGLSELNLGVPVPGASLRMLRSRLSSPAVDDLVFRGEGCTASRARELGLVHRTAPPEELLAVTDMKWPVLQDVRGGHSWKGSALLSPARRAMR